MAPHTILFMASNPTDTDARAVDEPARLVQVELERAGRRECSKLETRWIAQPLDVLRELVKLKPTVVHFDGVKIVGPRDTAHAPRAFDAADSVKLVLLDVCHTEAHAEGTAAHIDWGVGGRP